MRKANYWTRLVYNGVVIGIWPAAALAYIVTFYVSHRPLVSVFLSAFLLGLMIFIPAIALLYHKLVIPRRHRKPQRR